MKTLFAMGYFSNDVFQGNAALVPIALAGARDARLGELLDASGRSRVLASISAGTQKMAEVRKWIASLIDRDPMLARTLRDPGIVDNFWAYDDLVVKSQWYVDQTAAQLSSDDPAKWDVSEENLGRTDDWVRSIDILHGAMREYGGNQPVGSSGITVAPSKTSPVLLVAGALGVVGLIALLAKA